MEYKVTEKDLIGDIEHFPIEVVKKMIEEQVEQGNDPDVSVFQKDRAEIKESGGFSWCETADGETFWSSVADYKDFDLFFKKYPKQKQLTIQKDMETNKKVWIRGVLGRGDEVINELIKLGGNNYGLSGEILDDIYYIGHYNFIEFIRDDTNRAKKIMAEYKEIKLDDNPSITAFQDYGLHFSKDLSTFAKTCINLPEGSSVNICNENGKVMIIVEPKQVKEEECRFKDGDILLLTDKNKNNYIAIFESYNDECITVHGWLDSENNVFLSAGNGFFKKVISSIRCATEHEIAKLNKEFAEQKNLKWNAEELKFEPIRWRAEKGGKFWFITSNGVVDYAVDNYKPTDNLYFNLRNYFETPEIANKALPLWKDFFKNISL